MAILEARSPIFVALFGCFFTTAFAATCPKGYNQTNGDVGGFGRWSFKASQVKSAAECGAKCDEQAGCRAYCTRDDQKGCQSFEYSPTHQDNACNLNDLYRFAQYEGNFQDFIFCSLWVEPTTTTTTTTETVTTTTSTTRAGVTYVRKVEMKFIVAGVDYGKVKDDAAMVVQIVEAVKSGIVGTRSQIRKEQIDVSLSAGSVVATVQIIPQKSQFVYEVYQGWTKPVLDTFNNLIKERISEIPGLNTKLAAGKDMKSIAVVGSSPKEVLVSVYPPEPMAVSAAMRFSISIFTVGSLATLAF